MSLLIMSNINKNVQ